MSSGGFGFGSIKDKFSAAKGKVTGKIQDKMFGSMIPKMPSFGMPSIPGMAGISGAFGMGSSGKNPRGMVGDPGKKAIALPKIVFQVVAILGMSFFIGIFFTYINKNSGNFGFDVADKALIVTALVVMGIMIAYSFKLGILDFIISSEINILAFYLLLSYSSYTIVLEGGIFGNIIDVFKKLWEIVKDPTTIFKNGFALLIPIVLFLIPIFVLLFNATENIFLPIVVFAVSAAVVYILYPKGGIKPIAFGTPIVL